MIGTARKKTFERFSYHYSLINKSGFLEVARLGSNLPSMIPIDIKPVLMFFFFESFEVVCFE